MARGSDKTVECQICKQQKKVSVTVLGELVKPSIVEIILKKNPDWSSERYICFSDLNHFRAEYVREMLEDERGEVSGIEQEVIKSLSEHDLLAKDTSLEYEQQLTFGEKLADRVANFAGSWGFIGFATGIIIAWILINLTALIIEPYDPYPFILLNLVLSCIAALQAPIIIMSQNRQAERDRMRAREDYKVNLKAELEIRHLSDKIDHILTKQWERMINIMQIQMELMEEVAQKDKTEIKTK